MEDRLEQRQLWFVLSELFVDSKIGYEQVASVAKNYSLGEVEFVLFERVAPVCISNMLAPIPPICWYFDKAQLVMDIEALIERRAQQSRVGKCISKLKGHLIRWLSAGVWKKLKVEIEKTNGGERAPEG